MNGWEFVNMVNNISILHASGHEKIYFHDIDFLKTIKCLDDNKIGIFRALNKDYTVDIYP